MAASGGAWKGNIFVPAGEKATVVRALEAGGELVRGDGGKRIVQFDGELVGIAGGLSVKTYRGRDNMPIVLSATLSGEPVTPYEAERSLSQLRFATFTYDPQSGKFTYRGELSRVPAQRAAKAGMAEIKRRIAG